jgi:SOS response regulatory protein OraA/RecX
MKKTEQELAAEMAAPHLQKEGVERVFINTKGLIWINNELQEMESYFASNGEKYYCFENVTVAENPAKVKTKKPKKD